MGNDSYAKALSENSDGSGRVAASGKFFCRPGEHQQHIQCRVCGGYGHIAHNCGQKRQKSLVYCLSPIIKL